MSVVTRETSGIEIRVDKSGKMKVYFDGKRLPVVGVKCENGDLSHRGITTIEIMTSMITFSNEPEPEKPVSEADGWTDDITGQVVIL